MAAGEEEEEGCEGGAPVLKRWRACTGDDDDEDGVVSVAAGLAEGCHDRQCVEAHTSILSSTDTRTLRAMCESSRLLM